MFHCQQLTTDTNASSVSRTLRSSPPFIRPGRRCSFFRDKVTTVKRATGRFCPAAAICRSRIIRSSRFFNEISNAKPTSTDEQRGKKQFHRRRPCDTGRENSLLLSPSFFTFFFLVSQLAISFVEGKRRLGNTQTSANRAAQVNTVAGKQRSIDRSFDDISRFRAFAAASLATLPIFATSRRKSEYYIEIKSNSFRRNYRSSRLLGAVKRVSKRGQPRAAESTRLHLYLELLSSHQPPLVKRARYADTWGHTRVPARVHANESDAPRADNSRAPEGELLRLRYVCKAIAF